MADAPIAIDAGKCVGCGKCVKGCGFGALSLADAPGANKLGKLAVVDPAACKACSACVTACPFKAISEVRCAVSGTEDLESYKDIWVFAEQTDGRIAEVVLELLTKARELKAQRGGACRVCAVLLGNALPAAVETELAEYGADLIYKVEAESLADYEANVYVDAVAQLVLRHRPEVILAGAGDANSGLDRGVSASQFLPYSGSGFLQAGALLDVLRRVDAEAAAKAGNLPDAGALRLNGPLLGLVQVRGGGSSGAGGSGGGVGRAGIGASGRRFLCLNLSGQGLNFALKPLKLSVFLGGQSAIGGLGGIHNFLLALELLLPDGFLIHVRFLLRYFC